MKFLNQKKTPVKSVKLGRITKPLQTTKRSSTIHDPRPLRDPEFIKAAKCNLVKFLQETQYPHDIKFKTLTSTNVRNIFEHLLKMMGSSPAKVNETWVERVIKILNALHYPSNISQQMLQIPTSNSQMNFIYGAIDYLRRICVTNLNIHPEQLYAHPDNISFNSSLVVKSIADVYNRISSSASDAENVCVVDELKDLLQTEMDKIYKEREAKEEVFYQHVELKTAIEFLEDEYASLTQSLDELNKAFSSTYEHVAKLEKVERPNTKAELDELKAKVNELTRYHNALTREISKSDFYRNQEIEKTVEQYRKYIDNANKERDIVDSKSDKLRDKRREYDSELQSLMSKIKPTLVEVFNVFGSSSEEIRVVFDKMTLDDLINLRDVLMPAIRLFSNRISMLCDDEEKLLEQTKQNAKARKCLYDSAMENYRNIEELVKKERKDVEEQELSLQKLNERFNEKRKTYENICDNVNKIELRRQELAGDISMLKAGLNELDTTISDARGFYDATFNFEKDFSQLRIDMAEIEVAHMQKMKEEKKTFIEEQKSKMAERRNKTNKYISDSISQCKLNDD